MRHFISKLSLPIFILLASIGLYTQSAFAQLALDPTTTMSLAPMLRKAMPAVVNLNVRIEIPGLEDPFGRHFNGDNNNDNAPRKYDSSGSGVIIDAEQGYILTNAHLVYQAKDITVKLSDGRSAKAKVIGSDPPSDIAVIQIKEKNLTALPFTNSDNLQVGDFVAAIGNPFGLTQTVTSGIISGLQRSGLRIEGYESFIQTDASINPGNSGGALINFKGELIGINSAILSAGSGGNIGIGFAIPINMARSVMAQLIKYGSVRRGLMGVMVQNLTPELAHALRLPVNQGALAASIVPGSPAEKAGLQTGDVITAINGEQIKDDYQVRNLIGLLRVGSAIKIDILHDGKAKTVQLNIADPKSYQQEVEALDPFLFGLGLRDFYQQLPNGKIITGVEVTNVVPNTVASQGGLGLRPGDVIVLANKMPITNLADLKQAVKKDRQQLLVNVLRRGGALFIVLKP